MYTQGRVSEYPKCTTKGPSFDLKDFKKRKQERFPMKALLRSSIFALFVFAGYAAVATDISKPHSNAQFPQPQCPPRALCAIGK
jgi:hypothetical protein